MTCNLYVGNLSYDTTDETLRSLFGEHGQVESVNIITDRYTGRPRGFGFVEMETEEAGQAAISALNGKMVDNREIKVDKAKPRTERRQGNWREPRW
jgi:RNA recognition motif-containing protein